MDLDLGDCIIMCCVRLFHFTKTPHHETNGVLGVSDIYQTDVGVPVLSICLNVLSLLLLG